MSKKKSKSKFSLQKVVPAKLRARIHDYINGRADEDEVLDETFDFLTKVVQYGERDSIEKKVAAESENVDDDSKIDTCGMGQMARFAREKFHTEGRGLILQHYDTIFSPRGTLENTVVYAPQKNIKKMGILDPTIVKAVKRYNKDTEWILVICLTLSDGPIMQHMVMPLKAETDLAPDDDMKVGGNQDKENESPQEPIDLNYCFGPDCQYNKSNFAAAASEEKEALGAQPAPSSSSTSASSSSSSPSDSVTLNKCGKCRSVTYCSRDCQIKHWKAGHKRVCRSLAALRQSAA